MDPTLRFLVECSLTHSYIDTPKSDWSQLQRAVAHYTGSPMVSTSASASSAPPLGSSSSLDTTTLKDLYIMQFHLELMLSELMLARGTISRLKDLLGDNPEEVGALVCIVREKSKLLQVDASLASTNEDKIKELVTSYLDSAGELIVKSYNESTVTNLSNGGMENLRELQDLYIIKREKVRVITAADISKARKGNLNQYHIALAKKVEAIIDLLSDRPADLETLLELAHTYIELGKFKQALSCIVQVLVLEPLFDAGWSLRGEVCYLIWKQDRHANTKRGKLAKLWIQKAIECHQKAVEIDQLSLRSWCGLYVCLIYSNENANASNSSQLTRAKDKLEEFLSNSATSAKDIENIKTIKKMFPFQL